MKTLMPPDRDLLDTYLTEREFDACASETEALRKARAKYRAAMRERGPTGQLRNLACRSEGDSVVLAGYTSTRQISPMLTAVSLSEGVQFTSRIERSLVDDSITGVRVTLVAFTR